MLDSGYDRRSFDELRKGLVLIVQIAGLIATGWMIWASTVSPRLIRYSWVTLARSALGYALFALGWSLAITFVLYFAIPRRERGDMVAGTLRTSATAVWFAPAIILLTQMSPAALAASLVLVVSATRLLYSEWRLLYPPAPASPVWTPPGRLFGEGDPVPPILLRQLGPALAVALCLQFGTAAILLHAPLAAGALLAMGAAILTISAISTGASDAERPRDLPRSILGLVLTVMLAAGMTIGGMSGRVIRRPGKLDSSGRPDLVADARDLMHQLLYGEPPPAEEKAQDTPPSKETKDHSPTMPLEPAVGPDGSFPGVILVSEVKPVTRLVAPVVARRGLFGASARPYSIVFDGEYWMYRWLYRRPPPNSYFRKGSPAAVSFSTTDHWPLLMEAHQKLDQPVDLHCCNKVQVEIWNADRYPGTVWLEVFAMTADSSDAAQSLGTAQVQSTPDLKSDPVRAVSETLEFAIPAEETLDACTELKVVFRRDRSRQDKSAKVAIERFVLVPKAM
ncbi:MAG TPA: hypothetical protein VGH38_11205 [Bryobacteraceae bacterium]